MMEPRSSARRAPPDGEPEMMASGAAELRRGYAGTTDMATSSRFGVVGANAASGEGGGSRPNQEGLGPVRLTSRLTIQPAVAGNYVLTA